MSAKENSVGIKANFIEQKLSLEEQEKRKRDFAEKCSTLCSKPLPIENNIFKYSYDSFIRLVAGEDFSDLRISKSSVVIEAHSGERTYEMTGFDFVLLYQHLNDMVAELGVNNYIDGKYFSFHLPLFNKKTGEIYLQGFRGLLKTSIDGNEMTIRKLTTPRNNLNEFIYDHVLIEKILQALLSRKGFSISGRTGSGKSTILISLLNYFNNTNYTDVLLEEIIAIVIQMIDVVGEEAKNGNISSTLSLIREIYNTEENKDMIIQDVKLCLDNVQKYIFKNYSKKGEILSPITILKIIKAYVSKSQNERLKSGGKIIVSLFDNYFDDIQNKILEAEAKPINQSIKKFSQSRLRNITTLEEPIEFVYGKDGILRFFQHSISQHFNGHYFEFINQILRDNPHVCYIAEVRNSDEIDTFLTSMSLGISSMTTCHSYDSLEVLLKFLDLSSKGQAEVMNILTNSYHAGINIDSYFFTSLKSVLSIVNGFIQWYDYLDFSDTSTTTTFRNYYQTNNLGMFVEMMNKGYVFGNNKLAYYPKKLTLNYRLMLLWNDMKSKQDKLSQVPEFNFDNFISELIDLIFNTRSHLENADRQFLVMIYGEKDAERVMKFKEELENYPQYQMRKNQLAK